MSFDGQVVWVTGAGSGIGKALALELARQGAKVAISGRRQANLDEVVREGGGNMLAVPCDVTDEDAVRRAADTVVAKLGRMDAAVANAGVSVSGGIEQLSFDDWRRQLDVNVIGVAMTCKHALPHLRATKGRLGIVASVAAFTAAPRVGAYAASKAAVRMLGLSLAVELHGSGVSMSMIHPGYVESEIAQVDNAGHFDASRPDRRPKNLMWPADKAAKVMAAALWARKREFVFTGHGKVGKFLGQHAPGLLHLAMTRGKIAKRVAETTK